MSSTGFLIAGTGTSFIGGDVGWNDASNITASDDAYAITDSISSAQSSHKLICSNFGFSLPADAVINGVTVRIERSTGVTPSDLIVDHMVELGGFFGEVGDNKADTVTNWPTTDATADYGSTSDIWGTDPGFLTADLLNGDFIGVVIQCAGDGTGTTASGRIDAVYMAVEYDSNSEPVQVGTFVLSGQDANFIIPFKAAAGSFSLTGKDATFNTVTGVVLGAGSFVLTGQNVGLSLPGSAVPGVRLTSIKRSNVVLKTARSRVTLE